VSSFYRRKYRSIEIAVGPAYWPWLGWTAALALAQTTVVPLLAFRGAVPSLVTIAVVLYAVRAGARRGALLALPTIVALLVGGFTRRMFADGAFVPAILCGAAVLVRDLVFWSVMRMEGFPPGYAAVHAHASLWRALLTALVAFAWLVVRGRLVTDKTTIQRYGYD
jgi:hypothetical protein